MKRDDTVYLRHILDAIGLIQEYTKGMSEHEFISNSMDTMPLFVRLKLLAKRPGMYRMNFRNSTMIYLGGR